MKIWNSITCGVKTKEQRIPEPRPAHHIITYLSGNLPIRAMKSQMRTTFGTAHHILNTIKESYHRPCNKFEQTLGMVIAAMMRPA